MHQAVRHVNAQARVTHSSRTFHPPSKIDSSINMTLIEAALDSLKSLKLRESPNYTQIAKDYRCDRTTLSRRHRGLQGTYAQKNENQRLLTLTQEKELVKYINRLYVRGLPPLR